VIDAKVIGSVGATATSIDRITPVMLNAIARIFRRTCKRRRMLAHVLQIWNRHRKVEHVARAQLGPNQHEPVGITVREWPQQDAVHHAEHGGAGGNTECDRDHRDGCESGAFSQRAGRIGDVLDERIHGL
jgi:hypothetical protein